MQGPMLHKRFLALSKSRDALCTLPSPMLLVVLNPSTLGRTRCSCEAVLRDQGVPHNFLKVCLCLCPNQSQVQTVRLWMHLVEAPSAPPTVARSDQYYKWQQPPSLVEG